MSLKLVLRNNQFHVSGTVKLPSGEKIRVRRATGYNSAQRLLAEKFLGELLISAMDGQLSTANQKIEYISDAIREYNSRPTTTSSDSDTRFLSSLGKEFAKTRLGDFTLRECVGWLNTLGNKPNTVARKMTTINAMFNYLESIGYPNTPTWRCKKPSYDDARTRWLTEIERDLVIGHSPAHAKNLIAFLFYTGARLGEATRLTNKDIRGGKAFVWSRKGPKKIKKWRGIPIVPELEHELSVSRRRNCYTDHADHPVFQDEDGNPWTNRKFQKLFEGLLEYLSIEDFTPHDCRHTFASLLVQKGASLQAVAQLLGHSSIQMVTRYAHLAPNALDETALLLSTGVSEVSGSPRGTKLTQDEVSPIDNVVFLNDFKASCCSSVVERTLGNDPSTPQPTPFINKEQPEGGE